MPNNGRIFSQRLFPSEFDLHGVNCHICGGLWLVRDRIDLPIRTCARQRSALNSWFPPSPSSSPYSSGCPGSNCEPFHHSRGNNSMRVWVFHLLVWWRKTMCGKITSCFYLNSAEFTWVATSWEACGRRGRQSVTYFNPLCEWRFFNWINEQWEVDLDLEQLT